MVIKNEENQEEEEEVISSSMEGLHSNNDHNDDDDNNNGGGSNDNNSNDHEGNDNDLNKNDTTAITIQNNNNHDNNHDDDHIASPPRRKRNIPQHHQQQHNDDNVVDDDDDGQQHVYPTIPFSTSTSSTSKTILSPFQPTIIGSSNDLNRKNNNNIEHPSTPPKRNNNNNNTMTIESSTSSSITPKIKKSTTTTLDHFFYKQQPKIKYYRIIYKGFVALLNEAKHDSKKNGSYVSYGEIIATKTNEIDIQVPVVKNNNNNNNITTASCDDNGMNVNDVTQSLSSLQMNRQESNNTLFHPLTMNTTTTTPNTTTTTSKSIKDISPIAKAVGDTSSVISSSIVSQHSSHVSQSSSSSTSLPILPNSTYLQNHHHHHSPIQRFINSSNSSSNKTPPTKLSSPSRRRKRNPWENDDNHIIDNNNSEMNTNSTNSYTQQTSVDQQSPQQQLQEPIQLSQYKQNLLLPRDRNQETHTVTVRVIQVDDVLTGGYAIDALTKGTSHTHHTPRRSNAKSWSYNGGVGGNNSVCNSTNNNTTTTPLKNNSDYTTVASTGSEDNRSYNSGSVQASYQVIPGGIDRGGLKEDGKMFGYDNDDEYNHHGYLFLTRNGIPIAEEIPSPPLLCQTGPFFYRVISSVPLPILAGPCEDAPLTRAMALPGTVHEISLRMGSIHRSAGNVADTNHDSPMSSPNRGGLEDGVVYLRLSHRRGWIADRRHVLLPLQENPSTTSTHSHTPMKGHRRNGSGGSYSTIPKRKCIEFVMKEVSDYVDVSNFGISDEVSLGGTSISSASVATPVCIIQSRRRPVRRHNERDRRSVADSRSGMVVTQKPKKKKGKSKLHPAMNLSSGNSDSLQIPSSDVSLLSDPSNKSNSTNVSHSLPSSSQNDDISKVTNQTIIDDKNMKKPSQLESPSVLKPNVFLLRVTAPNGLKILDAPHFQVNNLIRGQGGTSTMPVMKTYRSTSTETTVSKPTKTPSSTISPTAIFHTMHGTSHTDYGRACSWELDPSGKKRILPTGVLFEASSRMERSGNFTHGSGLIKLADGTGWAIIPNREELVEQFSGVQGGSKQMGITSEPFKGYEEVGNAYTVKENQTIDSSFDLDCYWVRVVQATGVLVSCTSSTSNSTNQSGHRDSPITSTYSSDSSHSHKGSTQEESDTASTVSSVFSAFRSTKRKERKVDSMSAMIAHNRKILKSKHQLNIIPCGTCVQVEPWISSDKEHPENQVSMNLYCFMFFLLSVPDE